MQRCYQLNLPQTYGARCWGSSCGWVVTLDLNLEIYMFNPLTKARVPLPSQTTMFNDYEDEINDYVWARQCFVNKMIVFETDNERDDYIVIALPGAFPGCIAYYARRSDKAWTSIFSTRKLQGWLLDWVTDVVRWGQKLLFLYQDGAIGYCDMSALENSKIATIMEYSPIPKAYDPWPCIKQQYLLDAFGDLLMVSRHKIDYEGVEDNSVNYDTLHFKVYRFKFDTNTWVQVNDLGDVALFVGNNTSIPIRASHINNCKRNCIYFTDDEFQFWNSLTLFGGHDMGLFNMTNNEFETVYGGDDIHSSFCPSLWFMPKF
ncbi:putative F-box/kelch-repeat protein At4g12810 [Chenopodium quinoa]|uniref:putative F-box/kelch-repeat protein At4g12810 n=1 Tax=Chenopodium quinoa TaxID=63459 RepID=UPI000B77C054|nr:putative F-box/kelch-repeat protein At4g12810 [Chenopodium quinoa]